MSTDNLDESTAIGATSRNNETLKAQELMSNFISKNPENTYASLLRDNRLPEENCLLKYVAPTEGQVLLSYDEIDSVQSLGPCLVGCVVGRKLNGYVVKEIVRQWGGKIRFEIHDSGCIMFFFQNEEAKKRVLEGGPYLVFGRHLFLKELPPCFLFRIEDMMMLPSWVQIHGLPADCWTPRALSKIASVLGKPIHTDNLTMSKSKSLFARVLVEMDTTKPRIYEYPIMLPNGISTNVRFVYETEPKYCSRCNSLGHTLENCRWFATNLEAGATVNEDQHNAQAAGAYNSHLSRSRGDGNIGFSRPRGRGRGGRGDRGGFRGRGWGGAGFGGGRGGATEAETAHPHVEEGTGDNGALLMVQNQKISRQMILMG